MLRDGALQPINEFRQGEPLVMDLDPSGLTGKKFYVESYGCAMNFSDSEIVASILASNGYTLTADFQNADAVFINTCAIRENAEQRVRQRLYDFRKLKRIRPGLIIGVLGCMAERLKSRLLEEEKLVDLVAGPDAYRDLPAMLQSVEEGRKSINVLLSLEETYADISPVRLSSNGVSAFISIMRGCDNMCSFCVVPFTRGRERSRSPVSIIEEARHLSDEGYKEITLLGQNVDSYYWHPELSAKKEIRKQSAMKDAVNFAMLLDRLASALPGLRIRFSTSNPRDMTDEVLQVMAQYENLCKYIHLPVQSGSDPVLNRMNRGYSRRDYMDRIQAIRTLLPGCGISTDIITGFCGETEEDHFETLSLMQEAAFDFAYMFKYSERPGTAAAKNFADDVPDEIKTRRLTEIVNLQMKLSEQSNKGDVGKVYRVLIEGDSKKSDQHWSGRNSQNKVVVFPKLNFSTKKGDYADVKITGCTAATLTGKIVSV